MATVFDPNTVEQLRVLAKDAIDTQISENMTDLQRAISANDGNLAQMATRAVVSLEAEKEAVDRRSDQYIAQAQQAEYQRQQAANYVHPDVLEVVKMVRQSRPDYTVQDYYNDCQRVSAHHKFTHQGG
jgi:hypothetical protein